MDMAERWLRSPSDTRNEGSVDNAENRDSNSTYFESEAGVTMRANPAVEEGVQNAEVTSRDSNNATLSNITTAQLQDLLTTLMAAIQAESYKQTAALTETLKVQLSQEGEKLAVSLTEGIEATNAKFREELNGKLQQEIQGVSGKVDKLKRDTEHDIDNLTKSVGNLSEEVNSRVNAHSGQTRKELDKQGQEIINGSKVILSNIS
jgi:hypothetical protein